MFASIQKALSWMGTQSIGCCACFRQTRQNLPIENFTMHGCEPGATHEGFYSHRVTGGSCPPPVPTERGVRFLLRCTFGVPHHALRQVVHSTLLLFVPGSFPRSASSSLCIEGCHSLCIEPASPQSESSGPSRFPLALPFSEYYQLV